MNKALIVVDVQNSFMTGGDLITGLGGLCPLLPPPEHILPYINNAMANGGYSKVVLTQDFHPENHCSFAKNLGVQVLQQGTTQAGRTQIGWPVHCVKGTKDADFHPGLYTRFADLIIRKGTSAEFDSYSAFEDDNNRTTGLSDYLHGLKIDNVDIVGIATDYCVKYTALDARKYGFNVNILLQGCSGVHPNTLGIAITEMQKAGCILLD